MRTSYFVRCVLSSCLWAVIAFVIGNEALGRDIIWGGILIAPLIGLTVGWIYRPAYRFRGPAKAAMSLLTLYVSVSLFGLGCGIFDVLQGLPGGGERRALAVLFQNVLGCLWGITFTGYVVVLWPLAHLNHQLVNRVERASEEELRAAA